MAIGSGSDFAIHSKAIAARVDADGASVTYREDGEKKEIKASIVIGADGINSLIRKELFSTRPGSKKDIMTRRLKYIRMKVVYSRLSFRLSPWTWLLWQLAQDLISQYILKPLQQG